MILAINKKTGTELTFDSEAQLKLANTFGDFEKIGEAKDEKPIEDIEFEVIKPKIKNPALIAGIFDNIVKEIEPEPISVEEPIKEPEIISVPKKKGRPKKL